jgi:hypothetical protein
MSMTTVAQVRSASKSSRVPFYQAPGHPIAYFPSLAPYVGGTNAALLCCQLLYWTPRAKDVDGWIYKEQLEIMAETGMSRDEQRTARSALKTRGLLIERYDRLNHRLYFKIDVDAYNALIRQMYDEAEDAEASPKPLKINQIRKSYLAKLSFRIWRKTETVSGEIRNAYLAKDPETTTEITLPETPPEREKNVVNVASHHTKYKLPPLLSDREEALAQEMARHLDGDSHSLAALRRIVSDQDGLGEDIARRLFDDTMEQVEAHKIKTTPGRYFIDLAKREAERQGIDLGFRRDTA